MSHWVTHENPSCSHPRECLQVEFPSKETEQINPRAEQKTMVLHAFFLLPSSVNQLSLHISPSLSSPLGLSPPLPGTHLFLSWASSHASLMSPYSAPVEMSIIEFTRPLGAWSQHWERKWQLIVPSTAGSFSTMDLRGRELCAVCPVLKHNASVSCWIPLPGQLWKHACALNDNGKKGFLYFLIWRINVLQFIYTLRGFFKKTFIWKVNS